MFKMAIINDQHVFSGTSTHIYKLYENVKGHAISCDLYQFILDDRNLPKLDDVKLRYGILSKIYGDSRSYYNLKLALNFIPGVNWRVFKGIDADILLLSGPTLLPLVHHNKAKFIAIGHDLYFLHSKKESIFLRTYIKKMYRRFQNADFIIVNSNFTKKEFVENLKISEERIRVVYPSINNNVFYPAKSNIRERLGIREDETMILNVGGDGPNKNVETILRLLARLPENFTLVRVGRNFNTIKLIKNLNLSKRVILLGNVDEVFLAELYRGSDLLIFPSLFEGFGIPLVEAMSSGLPVVTSNRGSLPEITGDAGIICDPFDINCMRDAIISLTTNKNVRNNCIRKGFERAKLFSSEEQFKSLSGVLTAFSK